MGKGQLIMEGIQKINGRYHKACPKCGDMQSYLRMSYAKESLRLAKLCKKCSNRETDNCHRGYYNDMPVTWFNKARTSAEVRNIEFSISMDDVYNLIVENNFKCALSGMDISFNSFGLKHPASIDRIDSSKGYINGNIQVIHKDLNFMKQRYSQEYFIKVCDMVSKKWVKGS
jgi:hypothetical protein